MAVHPGHVPLPDVGGHLHLELHFLDHNVDDGRETQHRRDNEFEVDGAVLPGGDFYRQVWQHWDGGERGHINEDDEADIG